MFERLAGHETGGNPAVGFRGPALDVVTEELAVGIGQAVNRLSRSIDGQGINTLPLDRNPEIFHRTIDVDLNVAARRRGVLKQMSAGVIAVAGAVVVHFRGLTTLPGSFPRGRTYPCCGSRMNRWLRWPLVAP